MWGILHLHLYCNVDHTEYHLSFNQDSTHLYSTTSKVALKLSSHFAQIPELANTAATLKKLLRLFCSLVFQEVCDTAMALLIKW